MLKIKASLSKRKGREPTPLNVHLMLFEGWNATPKCLLSVLLLANLPQGFAGLI
jgi:hypothetical protein